MTAKEKARELLDKYKMVHEDERGSLWNEISIHTSSKQCALIAVDEILNAIKIELGVDLPTTDVVNFASSKIIFWKEVKQEIEKL
jgi:hypothetical protein